MFVFSSAAADAGLVTSRFHNTVIVAWPQHPMFAVGARPNKATPFSISAAGNVLADMAIIKRPDKTITRTRPVTSIHDRRSGWDRSQQGVGRYEIRAPPIRAVLLTQSVNLARWFQHSYVALSIYFADPSCARRVSRGRHSPAVGATVFIEPSGNLGMPLAETAWRNTDPDPDGGAPHPHRYREWARRAVPHGPVRRWLGLPG